MLWLLVHYGTTALSPSLLPQPPASLSSRRLRVPVITLLAIALGFRLRTSLPDCCRFDYITCSVYCCSGQTLPLAACIAIAAMFYN